MSGTTLGYLGGLADAVKLLLGVMEEPAGAERDRLFVGTAHPCRERADRDGKEPWRDRLCAGDQLGTGSNRRWGVEQPQAFIAELLKLGAWIDG